MRSFSILIFGFLALVFLSSCLNSKNHKEVQQETILSSGNFCFNNNIDSLLHIFIQKANCHGCYYEMYIDKKDENETLLCLRASLKYPEGINSDELLNDYLMKRNPMLYLTQIPQLKNFDMSKIFCNGFSSIFRQFLTKLQ